MWAPIVITAVVVASSGGVAQARGAPVDVLAAELVNPGRSASEPTTPALPARAVFTLRCSQRSACSGVLEVRRRDLRGRVRLIARPRRFRLTKTAPVDVALKPPAYANMGVRVRIVVRGYAPRTVRRSLTPLIACDAGLTLLATSEARVFRFPDVGVFACYGADRRPLQVVNDTSIPFESSAQERLAGHLLAFDDRIGWKGSSSRINVVDLAARQLVRTVPAPRSWACGEYDCSGPVTDLELREDGALAWIVQTGQHEYEVDKLVPTTQEPTRLDAGAGIDPASLELHRDSLTWKHDGTQRSATF